MKMIAKIVQGDDCNLDFTIKDKSNTAINVTSAQEIRFRAVQSRAVGIEIEKTLGAGVTITDGAAGQIRVQITDTDTADESSVGDYKFEVEITDAAGNISTVRDFNDQVGELVVLADLDT